MRKTITIVIIILILVAIIWGFFWMRGRSNQGVEIELVSPEVIQSGVPFDLTVNISNDSKNELRDSELTVALPEGIVFVGTSSNRSVKNQKVGTVNAKTLVQQTFQVVALSAENTVNEVNATLSYLPGSFNSRFESSGSGKLLISGAGLFVDVISPVEVLSGEEFKTTLLYRNESTTNFSDVKFSLEFPIDFSPASFSIEPDKEEKGIITWNIGSIDRGEESEIDVFGSLIGPDNSAFELIAGVSARLGSATHRIAEKVAVISMARSPLSLSLTLNSGNESIAGPSDVLDYTLRFQNNTNIDLRDIVLKARLEGEMFDLPSLRTDGALRSTDDTIIWNTSLVRGLSNLAPGQVGAVAFSIGISPNYPIKRINSKNFEISVFGEVESPTVPRSVQANRIVGIDRLTNKVHGQIQLRTIGLFRDAASGIINAGSLPPRVGLPTQYTIHWEVVNTSTDVENVKVKSFLGPNVRFTGISQSNTDTKPIYDERTQEIIWEIEKIPATRGVISEPVEAVFQVELVPAVDQANEFGILLQETKVFAKDLFTGVDLENDSKEVTTRLLDDPTIESGRDGGIKR